MNPQNGCSNSATVSPFQNTNPPVAVAASLNNLTCSQPTATLSSAGSTSGPTIIYGWSGGPILGSATGPTASASAAGSYILTVENTQNGCTATAETTVISIGQTGFPISILSLAPTCAGDCDGALLVENQPISGLEFSVNGSPFSIDTAWTGLCEGNYSLKIRDSNGCEWDSVRTLVSPPQVFVELGPDATVLLGDSLIVEAFVGPTAVDLAWSPAPPDCPGFCKKFRFSPLEPTVFQLVATAANGCTASDSQRILVENADDIYVPNALRPASSSPFFTVFAGPSVRKVVVLQVYSRWGELVFQQLDFLPNVPESGWDGRLRGDFLNPGVFVWRAKIEYLDGRTREISGDLTVF